MIQNQLSRYGAISRVIPKLAPGAKVFFVSDGDDTTVGPLNLGSEFPVDGDGVSRLYTTIQAAVNAATAGRGDVVLVLPGYDNTLARTDSWSTAGVSVIGLGSGNGRPIVRYGAITDEVGVGANNVTIENLRFLADADSVARALDLDSGFSGGAVRGCAFDFDSNTMNFKTMLRTAQPRSLIENNEFLAEDTLGAGSGVSLRGGLADYSVIRNNRFSGIFDTNGDTTNGSAAISVDITHDSASAADTVLSGLEVTGNTIFSYDTAAAVIVNLAGGATTVRGLLSNNQIASYDTGAADTAQVLLGGALGINNFFISADTDDRQSIVTTNAALLELDS